MRKIHKLRLERKKVLNSRHTHPVLRVAGIVDSRHTGKILHHRHSSHPVLVLLMILVGFFLWVTQDMVYSATQSGGVTVNLIVPGPPPTSGAVILQPANNSQHSSSIIQVTGTCEPSTMVVVYIAQANAGSGICTNAGVFSIVTQLNPGQNTIRVLNFDNLGQAGPLTSSVVVEYVTQESAGAIVTPELPVMPAVIPGVEPKPSVNCGDSIDYLCAPLAPSASTCDLYSYTKELPTGGNPRVSVVCYPNTIKPNQSARVGMIVWGGMPPYAVKIGWGDDDIQQTLKSIDKPGYFVEEASYQFTGKYSVKVNVVDGTGKQAYSEIQAKVLGAEKPTNFAEYITYGMSTSWFDTPVPMYVIALSLTVGFWSGDIFERIVTHPRFRLKTKH